MLIDIYKAIRACYDPLKIFRHDQTSENIQASLAMIAEQLSRITDGINSPWVMLSAIGTLLLAFVAFFGIDEIRSLFFRSHIRPNELKLIRTAQKKGTLIYHRLIVKNLRWIGWRPGKPAKDVRVLLTYVKSPAEFIPIPLRWTYWSKSLRDISKGEPAYLDVICYDVIEKKYKFCWSKKDTVSSDDPLLKYFNPKYGDIRLEFYERSGGLIGDMTIKHFAESDYFKVIRWS